MLRGDREVQLVLQRHAAPVYPEGFHIGFLVDDVATVEATHRALAAAGHQVGAIDVNARGTMLYCRLTACSSR